MAHHHLRCSSSPSPLIDTHSLSAPILPTAEERSSGCAFPVVIAAHPSQPNQIVLGMSDGAIYVIQPFDVEQNRGRIVPL
ncbi:unnamed protein product [Camellia sinensis]